MADVTGDGQFDYEDVAVLGKRLSDWGRKKIEEMSPRKAGTKDKEAAAKVVAPAVAPTGEPSEADASSKRDGSPSCRRRKSST